VWDLWLSEIGAEYPCHSSVRVPHSHDTALVSVTLRLVVLACQYLRLWINTETAESILNRLNRIEECGAGGPAIPLHMMYLALGVWPSWISRIVPPRASTDEVWQVQEESGVKSAFALSLFTLGFYFSSFRDCNTIWVFVLFTNTQHLNLPAVSVPHSHPPA